jgi:hypothetical protein
MSSQPLETIVSYCNPSKEGEGDRQSFPDLKFPSSITDQLNRYEPNRCLMMKPTLVLFIALLTMWGCSKEEFASTPKSEKYTANNVEVFQNLTCSNHTLVKPPVDILYLVDNSSSANYLSSTVRNQIALTIQSLSQEFDYRVMVAPLLPDGASDTFRPVITNNAGAMSTNVNVVPPDSASFFGPPQGSNERGFERAYQLINQNRISNGGMVFRNNAHTLVVLVSNGNDNETSSYLNGFPIVNQGAYDTAKARFITLKSNLAAQQFRFFSLVAHTSNCRSGHFLGKVYIDMSKDIYLHEQATDSSRVTKDSYDLCKDEYSIYSGVNSSIRQEVVGHTYNKWQVSSSTAPEAIDPVDIQVTKLTPSGAATTLTMNQDFTCCSTGTNVNTRIAPTPGEPKTGTFIDLTFAGRVSYPDCLVVRTRTPTEYYGFAVAPTKPRPETIVVRIRGANVPQSSTNGWSYEGYRENQNIKVDVNGNPAAPALNRTGYFIKLNGSAKYASGDTIELFYTPAPL